MKKALVLLLVLIAAFAVFAAGSGEAAKTTTAAANTPVKGGTLNIAVKGNPTSMLSWKLRGPIDRAYGCIIWEKLFEFITSH